MPTEASGWGVVRVPCTFPVENRPIYATPVAEMTAKKKDAEWPKMAHAVAKVCELHPDERILVHAVSYELCRYLVRHLYSNLGPSKSRVMTYAGADEREKVIERYREREGAVLIAPSLERGVDFKGDDCRVVVVCKMPYPYLGDKQVNARMHSRGGQLWYSVQTVRSLVQMTGRGVRSETDTCTTYILDSTFIHNVMKKSKNLLPKWWLESLDMSGRFVMDFKRPLGVQG